jgi:O-antigen/teichoic acid export membrane protein
VRPALCDWRHSRSGRIAAAVSIGAAARILSSVVTFLSLPLAVRYLGAERFGLWATVTSSVVVLNLLDLGITASLTNLIARACARGDRGSAARYTANALLLTAAIAVLVGIASAAVWRSVNWSVLLNVSAHVPSGEVSATVGVAVVVALMGLPASLSARVFAGFQEVHITNFVIAAGSLANLAGLFVGVGVRAPMPALFAMSMMWVNFGNLIALAVTLLYRKRWLHPRMALLDWAAARELLGSGSGFFLIQVAGVVVFNSDNLVVSHYLGATEVTPYSVTWRLVGLTAMLQSLLFPALWPAYADADARGDRAWMRSAFRLTMRSTLLLNSAFAAMLIVAGRPIIRWWAGPAAVPSEALLAVMAIWAVLSGCMTVESCLLAAVNRTREQGALSIVAAVVNLALSIVLVQRIGAVGVISGTILSYLLVLVVPQSLMVRNVLSGTVGLDRRQSTSPVPLASPQ